MKNALESSVQEQGDKFRLAFGKQGIGDRVGLTFIGKMALMARYRLTA